MYKKNRKVDNMRSKNKKTIVIGILCCLLVFMGVGFAILNQTLNIGGTTTATNTWAVLIESITPIENNTGAKNTLNEVLADKVSANFKVEFQKPGDYMEYTVVVANKGSIDATLKTVTSEITPEADASLFTFDYSEAPQGKTLAAGETTSFKIKITYNLSATTTPTGDVVFNLDLDYVQGTGSEAGGSGDGNEPIWDFEVDESGTITAYNYELGNDIVVPASVDGIPVTTIKEYSFMPKSNVELFADSSAGGMYVIISETEPNFTYVQEKLVTMFTSECQSGSTEDEIAACVEQYKGMINVCSDANTCYNILAKEQEASGGAAAEKTSIPSTASLEGSIYLNPDPDVPAEESAIMEPNVKTLDLSNATNLTTIEENALNGVGLTSVEFGDNSSVTTIGDSAFANSELTSIEIPASVETIGSFAFAYDADHDADSTTKLQTVTFETKPVVEEQLSENNKYSLSKMGSTATKLTSQKSALKSIGERAFAGNLIKTLVLPRGLVTIGDSAFAYNLIQSLVLPEGLETIEQYAFYNNQILGEVILPSSLTTIKASAFDHNQIDLITIPKTVTTLGNQVFNNNLLKNLIIEDCTNLCIGSGSTETQFSQVKTDVLTIQDGKIRERVFEHASLGSLNLGPNVTMDSRAFGFASIGTYTLDEDENVNIDPSPFYGASFENLTIEKCTADLCSGGVKSYDNDDKYYGNKITNLTINSGEIGENAFYSLEDSTTKIQTLTLGEGVTSIADGAFYNNNIEELVIPSSVESIGVFTTVGVSYVGAFARNNISKLTFVDGSKLISIGDQTFNNNQLVGEIVLPNNLDYIGYTSFANNKIQTVTIPEGVLEIARQAFLNNSLTTISIPASVTSLYPTSFTYQRDELGNPTLTSVFVNHMEADFLNNVLIQSNEDWYDTTLNPTIRYK